ncbi:MAG: alcohol dehydrogenase [Verrucomicrobia bacterium]|nr:MAG: alcohol dehydrogenase [Verrucomicrobiota bacterium]PYJ98563.1 MAG: alcohol dehydrogenase [Verrucomicrobiota bacterium]
MKKWPRTNCLRIRDALLRSFAALTTATLCAVDWPQYRGPNHDGLSTETIRTNWSVEPPRQVWKVPLDPALSSFSVSAGKAFTMVRRPVDNGEQEFCIALNADTGAELWASVPLGIADYPNGGVGSDDGPRSTPSVDGDRLYILTSYLRLYCLSVTNGAVIWSKDLVTDTEYGSTVIAWQSAASALIDGDLVFVIGNAANKSLFAFHKADGSEAWKGQSDVMTQASPIAATVAGVRQIIFFAQSGLVSVAPDTGSVLWRYPFPFSTATAASPVVGDDLVYCSAAYGMGSGAVRITNSGSPLTAIEVWRAPGANMNHWATPVLDNGYLYGVYGQAQSGATMRCVDFKTGMEQWRHFGVGLGGVLFTTGHVLVLTEDGYLLLVKPDPTAYVEAARFRALDGSKSSVRNLAVRCWNVPAISNGRIYARSTTEAVCLEVAAGAPPLKLNPTLVNGKGTFRIFIGNEDGSPLDTNRVANIDILASTDLTLGLSGWIKLTNPILVTNGRLQLDDPQSSNTTRRFFRVEERP